MQGTGCYRAMVRRKPDLACPSNGSTNDTVQILSPLAGSDYEIAGEVPEAARQTMRYLLGLIALVVGLAVGDWFPDIDQKTSLLLHRSIVTHGPLVPLIVFAATSATRSNSHPLVCAGHNSRRRDPSRLRPVPQQLVGFRPHQRSKLRLDGFMVFLDLDSHQHSRMYIPGAQAGTRRPR